ncbi:MAG: hypothetical protein QG622_95, partial [Actinomycetota bacterium]|nr:hypothetical protein [Actinomycetota bacterium]
RMMRGGYVERIRHGVYRIAGAPPAPADGLRAVWLGLGAAEPAGDRLVRGDVDAVVSHTSAAWLHDMGDLPVNRYEFTVDRRRQTRDPEVRFHRRSLDRRDWGVVDGLPVTTPVRTIIDLAAARLDGEHLAGVVRDGLTRMHLDPDEVARALRPFAHLYDAPLGDGEAFLVDLLRRAGLPAATHALVRLLGQGSANA